MGRMGRNQVTCPQTCWTLINLRSSLQKPSLTCLGRAKGEGWLESAEDVPETDMDS